MFRSKWVGETDLAAKNLAGALQMYIAGLINMLGC